MKMTKKRIAGMATDQLREELERACRLITDLQKHLDKAVAFYGYAACVEELKEDNYDLQRRCMAYLLDPKKETLIKWCTHLFDQLRMAKGLKPGRERELDEIGEFLGFADWVKVQKERVG
jgi:hypothetical protein